MDETMKKVGRKMSLYMGVTMSFVLSLVGNLSSGHFTFPGFLLSFVISTVVALLIGMIVPVGKITRDALKNAKLAPDSTGGKLLSALISDLIYTPVMTLLMVFLAYRQAVSHGAQLNFLSMFLPSLLLSLVVGYFCIFFIEPVYMNLVMKDVRA